MAQGAANHAMAETPAGVASAGIFDAPPDQQGRQTREPDRRCQMLLTRSDHIHFARVHLREARARRVSHPRMWETLMQWARNSRLRAAAMQPPQGELFRGER